ncbi:MAG: DNA polymerase ligase N-terminal domain-containing protein [Spirochaetia bacterium]
MAGEMNNNLEEYKRKRDFRKTREPEGKPGKESGKPIFVIQKHDASNLHYDFRIEVDGVLKSWAVPKGLSTDPKDKRLAIHTEDHPLEYADFEGTIPEDQYGGGTVMVWDRGTYENIKDTPISDALDEGHLEIHLKGKKLEGGYALIRTPRGGKEQWLIIKMKDDYADARRNPVSTEPDSVVTGRSLEDIRNETE